MIAFLFALSLSPSPECITVIRVWRTADTACAEVRAKSTGTLASTYRAPECVEARRAGEVVVEMCQPGGE